MTTQIPENTDELHLALRAKSGDMKVWPDILRSVGRPLALYLHNIFGDEQKALDLVQETFFRAMRDVSMLQHPAKLRSWLFSIAWHLALKEKRREEKHPQISEAALRELDAGRIHPAECFVAKENEGRILDIVNALPEHQKKIFLLWAMEGFDYAEICEITGLGLNTVRMRLHHARQALKIKLKSEFDGDEKWI